VTDAGGTVVLRRTPTLEERAELWISSRPCIERTRRKYRETFAHIPASLKRTRVAKITRDDMTRLAADMTARYAPKTARATVTLVNSILEEAVICGLIQRNPATRLSNMPKRRNLRPAHAITREEYARLVAAAPEDYTALVALLPLTGLRIGEAAGLDKGDVDLAAATLTVRRQVQEGALTDRLKSDAAHRTVDLIPLAADWFRAQFTLLPDAPWVFGGARGNRLSPRIADEVFVRLRLASGIDVVPHDLRHTFGSWLTLAGADALYVARQMGHEDAAFTLRTYCHELAEDDSFRARSLAAWLHRETDTEGG